MGKKVLVWDVGTRLFHWLLVASILFSWVSAELGGNWMIWHMKSGYFIAGLLIFRIIWGFIGSGPSRFRSFIKGPKAVINYLSGKDKTRYLTHNPAGALSVLALISITLLMVITGLFGNDDIFIEGPLAYLISYENQLFSTELHHILFKFLMLVIVTHILAIIWYQRVKGEELIKPMLDGYKESEEGAPKLTSGAPLYIALATAAAVVVWLLVTG